MASADVLVAFIVERVSQDVSFLAGHGFISREDAGLILERLTMARPTEPAGNSLAELPISSGPPSYITSARAGQKEPIESAPTYGSNITPIEHAAALKRVAPPPPARAQYARALWDYNLDHSEHNDLVFHKGDIIQVNSETNADWWNGSTRGKNGLFPSNHVERIPYNTSLVATPGFSSPSSTPEPGSHHQVYEKGPYSGSTQMSPPPSHPYAPNGADGDGVIHVQDPERKDKGKKLRGQMGNAVATGFGFGAGAAVAGNIVNAIF